MTLVVSSSFAALLVTLLSTCALGCASGDEPTVAPKYKPLGKGGAGGAGAGWSQVGGSSGGGWEEGGSAGYDPGWDPMGGGAGWDPGAAGSGWPGAAGSGWDPASGGTGGTAPSTGGSGSDPAPSPSPSPSPDPGPTNAPGCGATGAACCVTGDTCADNKAQCCNECTGSPDYNCHCGDAYRSGGLCRVCCVVCANGKLKSDPLYVSGASCGEAAAAWCKSAFGVGADAKSGWRVSCG